MAAYGIKTNQNKTNQRYSIKHSNLYVNRKRGSFYYGDPTLSIFKLLFFTGCMICQEVGRVYHKFIRLIINQNERLVWFLCLMAYQASWVI